MKLFAPLFILSTFSSMVILSATGHAFQPQPIPAFLTASPTNAFVPGGGYTLGTFFTVGAVSEQVAALGLWDQGSDGFAFSHTVTIWNTTTHLAVIGVTVPAGTSSLLDPGTQNVSGGYAYVSVIPTVLVSGQSYVIGTYYGASDTTDLVAQPGGGQTTSADFTNVLGGYTASNTVGLISEPDSNFGQSVGWAGPNFQYTAAVPEPGILGLLGIGTAGLLARRRRIS